LALPPEEEVEVEEPPEEEVEVPPEAEVEVEDDDVDCAASPPPPPPLHPATTKIAAKTKAPYRRTTEYFNPHSLGPAHSFRGVGDRETTGRGTYLSR
jgi:hypothetical protein